CRVQNQTAGRTYRRRQLSGVPCRRPCAGRDGRCGRKGERRVCGRAVRIARHVPPCLEHARILHAIDYNVNDMHMTCWCGTAKVLAGMKDRWKVPLVSIGQPAEEIGSGARMMLADGLFKRFPRPDYCLALHCDGTHPHGHVAFTEGLALANVDSVDIIVKGKG